MAIFVATIWLANTGSGSSVIHPDRWWHGISRVGSGLCGVSRMGYHWKNVGTSYCGETSECESGESE